MLSLQFSTTQTALKMQISYLRLTNINFLLTDLPILPTAPVGGTLSLIIFPYTLLQMHLIRQVVIIFYGHNHQKFYIGSGQQKEETKTKQCTLTCLELLTQFSFHLFTAVRILYTSHDVVLFETSEIHNTSLTACQNNTTART